MSLKRVVIRGVLDGYSSYGLHLMHVTKGLLNRGHYVNTLGIPFEGPGTQLPRWMAETIVHRIQPEDYEIVVHCPSFAPAEKRKIIYNTMWETTRMDRQRMLNLANSEAVIVPSEWQATCFSAQGLNRPIYVVPMGIDTDVFTFAPRKASDVFTFTAAGRVHGAGCRKMIGNVIKCFREEFEGVADVRLEIKCYPGDEGLDFEDERIILHKEFWDRSKLLDFYKRSDVFVSCSRGEGWGLMQHEAMAVGRTVIGTSFGGTSAFFDERVGLPVDYSLIPVVDEVYKSGGLWADPDLGQVKSLMRECYEGRIDIDQIGYAAAGRAARLGWDNSNDILVKALEDIGCI